MVYNKLKFCLVLPWSSMYYYMRGRVLVSTESWHTAFQSCCTQWNWRCTSCTFPPPLNAHVHFHRWLPASTHPHSMPMYISAQAQVGSSKHAFWTPEQSNKSFFSSVIAISILTYKNNEDILKEISGKFVQRMTLKTYIFIP